MIPPIQVRQNEEPQLRVLAAQRRLYSDAKQLSVARVTVLACGSILAPLAALVIPEGRAIVGGLFTALLAVVHLVGAAREKRCNRDAASVQEQFDVTVFRMPWNEVLADRPTPTLIADAARRYDGPSTLSDWYPETQGVPRPLDVLICQRSNLGWGAALHRGWAARLMWAVLSVTGVAVVIGLVGGFSLADFLLVVLLPLLPLLREGYEGFRAHSDSAEEKIELEQRIMALWRTGLQTPDCVTVNDCRAVQDRILMIRRTNAVIPDWYHNRRRSAYEAAMRTSADDLVAEAQRHAGTEGN